MVCDNHELGGSSQSNSHMDCLAPGFSAERFLNNPTASASLGFFP